MAHDAKSSPARGVDFRVSGTENGDHRSTRSRGQVHGPGIPSDIEVAEFENCGQFRQRTGAPGHQQRHPGPAGQPFRRLPFTRPPGQDHPGPESFDQGLDQPDIAIQVPALVRGGRAAAGMNGDQRPGTGKFGKTGQQFVRPLRGLPAYRQPAGSLSGLGNPEKRRQFQSPVNPVEIGPGRLKAGGVKKMGPLPGRTRAKPDPIPGTGEPGEHGAFENPVEIDHQIEAGSAQLANQIRQRPEPATESCRGA